MYFQSLEDLKKSHYSTQRKREFIPILEDLDVWLMSLNKQKSRRINPLEFAKIFGYRWDLVALLFDDVEQKGTLDIFFELISENGMEILYRTSDFSEFNRMKYIYSEQEDDEIPIDKSLINIWYCLTEKPKADLISIEESYLKKEKAPTYNIRNVSGDESASSAVKAVLNRKRR